MRALDDPAGFIRSQTALQQAAMVPELQLWLASEITPIWEATEAVLERIGIDPPYWAFCWPGGQAVARYMLDNPAVVLGRSVFDFAAGGGIASLAARRAGARKVIANEIDPMAIAAIALNGATNEVDIETDEGDWLDRPGAPEVDVVIAGDVCYEREMSLKALAWLRSHARHGRQVLLGDPGRNYFTADGLVELARYEIPTSLQLENRGMRETTVWRVMPA